MKFSLASDMHLDFPQAKTPYEKFEKNVIFAGDGTNGLTDLKFYNKMRNKGFNVFAIDGNHTHYGNVSQKRSIEETIKRFRENSPNNWEFDGIPIAGCNGWYYVNDPDLWYGYMNDGRYIVGNSLGASANYINVMADIDYYYISTFLANVKDKCIIVTHTAPCLDTLNPEYEGHFSKEWFYNPLMTPLLEQYQDKILVWCHGHTHAASDKIVNGVRVVCNPRGYPGENPNWKPLTIEV